MQSSCRAGSWDTWAWGKAGAGSRLGELTTGQAGNSSVCWHPGVHGGPRDCRQQGSTAPHRGEKQAEADQVLAGRGNQVASGNTRSSLSFLSLRMLWCLSRSCVGCRPSQA